MPDSLSVSGRLAETGRAMASASSAIANARTTPGRSRSRARKPRGPASERRDRADAEARRALVLAERPAPEDERHEQRAGAGTIGAASVTPSHSRCRIEQRIGDGAHGDARCATGRASSGRRARARHAAPPRAATAGRTRRRPPCGGIVSAHDVLAVIEARVQSSSDGVKRANFTRSHSSRNARIVGELDDRRLDALQRMRVISSVVVSRPSKP